MGDDSRFDTDVLRSWKEIAAHLGRDVRTAIRWERDRGLPVHRVPGGQRGAVFAYRSEIDGWLRSRGPEEGRVTASAGGPTSEPGRASSVPPLPAPAPSATITPLRTPVVEANSRPAARRWPWGPIGAASVLMLLTMAGGAMLAGRPAGRRPAAAARIDKLDYGPRELIARAEDGSVVWRYPVPRGVQTYVLAGSTSPWYAIADLNGDGRSEVVASVPLHLDASGQAANADQAEDEIFCFSADGEVSWHTHLDDRLTFRAGTFDPPWLAGHVAVFHAKDGPRIAWSVVHHTWWPSALVVFDGKGTRLSTFVHAGSIRALRAAESGGRPLLLAGGVSNAYRAAFLAVLDGETVTGHGPLPAGSPYACVGCAEALPLRYFLFPPSDINGATGMPYNTVRAIVPYEGAIEVFTLESSGHPEPIAELNFAFSLDLTLLDARSADSWPVHEAFERAGKLDHGVGQCPWYLKPPPVRQWDAERGWRDVKPLHETVIASGRTPR